MNDMTFQQLKKNAKKEMNDYPIYKLAILGTCATQHLASALRGYAYIEGLNLEIFDADYDQIDAQVTDKDSELYKFLPDAVLIFMCSEKLHTAFCKLSLEERAHFAEINISKINHYWSLINEQIKAQIIQFNFVEIDDRVFGNYASKTETSFIYQLRKLNYLLMESCNLNKSVFLADLGCIQNLYGRNKTFDNKFYGIAKMALSTEILPEVAKQVIDIIKSLRGTIKKCIILDLDNTLWEALLAMTV